MAQQKKVPDKVVLERWVSEGLTTQEMADRVFADTGERITRNAISVAMARHDMPPLRPRYADLLPWKVRSRHLDAHEARMLRREGRRRAGAKLTAADERQLDNWLKDMAAAKAVVTYRYDSPDGFYCIPQDEHDTDIIRDPSRNSVVPG